MRSAQALLEYLLALAALLLLCGILWGFVDAAFGFSERAEKIVSSEYP